ncbi:hypothetical protein IFR05_000622 [Cadophora sp. M221]|nr:hypothetical protein IFR05_000622 [Cadophora sp. M221]
MSLSNIMGSYPDFGLSQIATTSGQSSNHCSRPSKKAKFETCLFESDPTSFLTFLVGPNALEFRIHQKAIYHQVTPTISTVTFQYIYANTLPEPAPLSVLRKFIVAEVAAWASVDTFGYANVADTFPPQMLADLCKLLIDYKEQSGGIELVMSEFWVNGASLD